MVVTLYTIPCSSMKTQSLQVGALCFPNSISAPFLAPASGFLQPRAHSCRNTASMQSRAEQLRAPASRWVTSGDAAPLGCWRSLETADGVRAGRPKRILQAKWFSSDMYMYVCVPYIIYTYIYICMCIYTHTIQIFI